MKKIFGQIKIFMLPFTVVDSEALNPFPVFSLCSVPIISLREAIYMQDTHSSKSSFAVNTGES